jgi:UPF0755 protein
MTARVRRWLLATGGLVFIAGLVVVSLIYLTLHEIDRPRNPGDQSYVIEPGQHFADFAEILAQRGVIESSIPLTVWARFEGVEGRIKAGEYRFDDGDSLRDILDAVVTGAVVRYQVTFIEGWRFAQFQAALDAAVHLKKEAASLTGEEIMDRLGGSDVHPEGQFFPDTYSYVRGETDLDVLARAHLRMKEMLEKAWEGRQTDLPLDSAYDALVLASIVEKETSKDDERSKVAGVFVNRLRRKMRLQTDPTVIYGVGDDFDGNLTRTHLRTDTPYNTYTRRGLPPTPIAMPGWASLEAATQPESTEALFFVSKGDGSHVFSETLEQHQQAVRTYQLRK